MIGSSNERIVSCCFCTLLGGGHGDTFSIKGNYFHFRTALDVALDIEKERLRMTGMDHGAFVYRLGLNKTYNARNGDHCVYAFRYGRDGIWIEEWYDDNLKRAHFPTK